jgi:hypothetical protein
MSLILNQKTDVIAYVLNENGKQEGILSLNVDADEGIRIRL